jgi:hypothetical protein
MIVDKTVSTKVKISRPAQGEVCLSSNSYPVEVAGRTHEFVLDGQLESFVPSSEKGDVRSLKEAANLVYEPQVQSVLDDIRKTDSPGGKIDLKENGVWDVYNMLGTVSISRLDPKDGDRHRITFRQGYLNIYRETTVGQDTIKQNVQADFDLRSGKFDLQEEWLTIESKQS